jgi:hypothetical protein
MFFLHRKTQRDTGSFGLAPKAASSFNCSKGPNQVKAKINVILAGSESVVRDDEIAAINMLQISSHLSVTISVLQVVSKVQL